MNAKQRYNGGKVTSKQKNLGPSITTPEGDIIDTDCRKDKEEMNLIDLFEEAKNRYVFNPLNKTIDFANMKPTDYKLNRHVKFPRPLDTDREFEIETRRRNYIGAFRDYKKFLGKIITRLLVGEKTMYIQSQ